MDPALSSSEMDALLAKAEPIKDVGADQPRCYSSRLSPNEHFCDLSADWGGVESAPRQVIPAHEGNWCYVRPAPGGKDNPGSF